MHFPALPNGEVSSFACGSEAALLMPFTPLPSF
jgi:hypothetical protein